MLVKKVASLCLCPAIHVAPAQPFLGGKRPVTVSLSVCPSVNLLLHLSILFWDVMSDAPNAVGGTFFQQYLTTDDRMYFVSLTHQ